MKEWISCAERMPEKGVEVWGAVYGSDVIVARDTETIYQAMKRSLKENQRAVICTWMGENDGWYHDGFYMTVRPTMWMPIERPDVPEFREV